jgi:hypothetical protein
VLCPRKIKFGGKSIQQDFLQLPQAKGKFLMQMLTPFGRMQLLVMLVGIFTSFGAAH